MSIDWITLRYTDIDPKKIAQTAVAHESRVILIWATQTSQNWVTKTFMLQWNNLYFYKNESQKSK